MGVSCPVSWVGHLQQRQQLFKVKLLEVKVNDAIPGSESCDFLGTGARKMRVMWDVPGRRKSELLPD